MKLSKLTVVLVVAVLLVSVFATTASAYSKSELSNYIGTEFQINDTKYLLRSKPLKTLRDYLDKTEVSDEQAKKIKDFLDAGLTILVQSGITSDTKFDATRPGIQEALAKVQDAAKVMGGTVYYDMNSDTITVYDANWAVILQGPRTEIIRKIDLTPNNGGAGAPAAAAPAAAGTAGTIGAFRQTGSTISVFAVVSLVAMVAVSAYFVKKVNA